MKCDAYVGDELLKRASEYFEYALKFIIASSAMSILLFVHWPHFDKLPAQKFSSFVRYIRINCQQILRFLMNKGHSASLHHDEVARQLFIASDNFRYMANIIKR